MANFLTNSFPQIHCKLSLIFLQFPYKNTHIKSWFVNLKYLISNSEHASLMACGPKRRLGNYFILYGYFGSV
jgi:hypothetical protein